MSVYHHDLLFEPTSLATRHVQSVMGFRNRGLCATTSTRERQGGSTTRIVRRHRPLFCCGVFTRPQTPSNPRGICGPSDHSFSGGGCQKGWFSHNAVDRDGVLGTSFSEPSPTPSIPENLETTDDLIIRFRRFLIALYKFSRPHTVAGTVTSICSISLLALQVVRVPNSSPLFTIHARCRVLNGRTRHSHPSPRLWQQPF